MKRNLKTDGLPIPKDWLPDSSLALLRDGYRFTSRRFEHFGCDSFETRLMFRRALCFRGQEAARKFYEPGLFTRRGAMPPMTLRLLQDKGSVQTLDGSAHHARKALFLSVLNQEGVRELGDRFEKEWHAAVGRWPEGELINLHTETQKILCRSVCTWAGLPIDEKGVSRRRRELAAMIDGAGSVGPRNWKGLLLRMRCERWVRRRIREHRGPSGTAPASAVETLARFRDENGKMLDDRTAAVELINILRPTLAVARYIVFTALALHDHPAWKKRMKEGGDADRLAFVHEVRRFYPFFPVIGGRAMKPFVWRDREFPAGTWVLLDLNETNHHHGTWENPGDFNPGRFLQHPPGKYDLIPQGGGRPGVNHRCAGESLTIELMMRTLRLLVDETPYRVPEQDLSCDLSRMPTLPRSGFQITV